MLPAARTHRPDRPPRSLSRRMSAGVSLLALAGLATLAPRVALAQNKPAGPVDPYATTPSADPRTQAAKAIAADRYTKGAELAKQKKWQEAYPALLEAWKHLEHWQIAVALGRVEIEIGKFKAASQHLSFALAAKDLPAVDRPAAEKLLATAGKSLGILRIEATAEAPAELWVDDEKVGSTPFSGTTPADPGEHRVEVRHGDKSESRTVVVRTAVTEEVRIELRLPELKAPPPGRPPPLPTAPVPTRTVVLAAGMGLAAVALGAGIGTATASIGKSTELQEKGRVRQNQALENQRATLANVSAWSFIGAGLLAGGAVAAVFLLPDADKKKAARVEVEWLGTGARAGVAW
jgi:hypothetical protein